MRIKDVWGGYIYYLPSEASVPALESIKDAHSFVISSYIRWIKVYMCAQISLYRSSSWIQGIIHPHSQITEDSEVHMTCPTPSKGIFYHARKGKLFMEESQKLHGVWIWIPLAPNSELIYNSSAFPVCRLQGKTKRPKGEIWAKTFMSFAGTACRKQQIPWKMCWTWESSYESQSPWQDEGTNHTATLSGR